MLTALNCECVDGHMWLLVVGILIGGIITCIALLLDQDPTP